MARWRDPIWASAEQVIRPEVDAPRWLDQALSLGVTRFSGPMSLAAQRALIAEERALIPRMTARRSDLFAVEPTAPRRSLKSHCPES